MTSAIEVRDLCVTYGTQRALADVTLTVPRGSITGVVGPNGSGKSTLAKAIAGLVPTTGQVRIADGGIGYMPQSSRVDLDFPVTVFDVVLMGTYGNLGWFRRPGASHRAQARQAMELTRVSDLADRPLAALSGGQRQRVFLARALAQQPAILILDEPFAGVDVASEAAIIDVLRSLDEQTVVIVHHDLATVRSLCDWAVVLKDGRLVAAGADALSRDTLRAAYDLPDFC